MSRLFANTPFDRPPICPHCGKAPADCRCMQLPPKKKMSEPATRPTPYALTPQNASPPPDQLAKIKLEKRKGKGGGRLVTLITGLDHPANDLPKLCTFLKTALSTGGSVQNRTLEIQGHHPQKILTLLQQKSLKARIIQ